MASILYILFVLSYLQCTTWAQSLGLAHECSDPTTYSWMYNAQGQSPCEMAVNLVYVCTSDENGPSLLNIPCTCNTVTYSLSNACRICSGIDQSKLPSFGDYANSFECSKAEAVAEGSSDPGSSSTSSNEPQTPTTTSGGQVHAVSTSNPTILPSASHTSSNSITTRATSPDSGFVSSGSKDPTQSLPGTTTGQSPATASPDGTQLPDGLITIVNSATVTSVLRESATVTSSQTQTTSPSPSSRKTGYPNAVIAGAVSAALLTLLAIGVGSLFFFRRRRRRRRHHRRHRIARTASRLRRTKGQTSVQPPPTSKEDLLVDIPSPGSPLKLYDPDDPSTYPPPLSEIARVAPNVRLPTYTR
ncbi:hypothetical protein PYCCODRAFT_475745 [Trametes coccinea BRFM310]|uniref:Uncharacterized protein n=1 Tax=Trametes coccinea (strain BRFM310) TaxID=1353009 RepID=A0A1Y2IP98_TRAC3|nr:hypothetical protein PYCCODRAFT_475745 [Trametes coccinea BRFM310]